MGSYIYNNIILKNSVDSEVPANKIIASLSNGETIFEDIGIPNQDPFWSRLKKLIKASRERVSSLRYQIGRYTINIASNQKFYYYKKRIYGNLGENMFHETKIGFSENGKIFKIYKYGNDGGKWYDEELKDDDIGILKNF